MMTYYVVYDIETTGLITSKLGSEICEIAFVLLDESFTCLAWYSALTKVKNYEHAELTALEINGFSQLKNEVAEDFATVWEKAMNAMAQSARVPGDGAVDEYVMVMHNAPFDTAFTLDALHWYGIERGKSNFRRVLDTVSLGYVVFAELLSLKQLSEKLYIEGEWRQHTALGDAQQTAKVFAELMHRTRDIS